LKLHSLKGAEREVGNPARWFGKLAFQVIWAGLVELRKFRDLTRVPGKGSVDTQGDGN
jgi:hypothetical protein